jgi:hypothetical protein
MSFRRDGLQYLEGDEIAPTNLRKNRVENFAKRVAKVGDFEIGGDLELLTEQFGGTIHFQHMEEWLKEDGSIFVHGRASFDIVLPYYTSPLRDRFTVAHELGHYFLHSDQGQIPIIAFRQGSTRIEWEANWFAAALLMPESEFTSAFRESGSLAEVAMQFGVSQDAAKVRKNALGL